MKKLTYSIPLPIIFSVCFGGAAVAAPPTYPVGVQPDGSVVVATDQVLTPSGAQVVLPASRANAVALRPDGKTASVLAVSGNRPVRIVDLASGTELQEFAAPTSDGSASGIIYSADGNTLFASQDRGRILIADVGADGTLSNARQIVLPTTAGTPAPDGLALSADQRTLYVVLNQDNAVGIIDLATLSFTGRIPVGNAPRNIAIVGQTAYVTNEGGRPAVPADFTVGSGGTRIVANTQTGAATTGTVSVIDLVNQVKTADIQVGLHPTAIIASNNQVFVANTNSDSISVIDPATAQVVQTIAVHPYPGSPFGSSPNALAADGAGRLYVSLGTNNAIATYTLGAGTAPATLEGLIPTGFFPGAVAVAGAQQKLVVVNVKGIGSLGKTSRHSVYDQQATVSLIPIPAPGGFSDLTRQVYANNHWDPRSLVNPSATTGTATAGNQVPAALKHVFLVIKENRTYDQVFGDVPRSNADPSLLQFGADVTPNHHALAERFPLLDNFYASGLNSADGHQWVVQSMAPDYQERQASDNIRSYPYNGGDSLVYGPGGFLWTNALAHGLKVRVYGEYADRVSFPPGTPPSRWVDWYRDSQILEGKATGALHLPVGARQQSTEIPDLASVLNPAYPGFDGGVPDQYRMDVFLQEFRAYVRDRNLPDLIIMHLPADHTNGTSPGTPTPRATVADNDLALGRLVDAISHSPYWKQSAIFVEEDDSQAGLDHVDGHRMPGFVISPWVKQGGVVDSTYYTQINMNSTIEAILGLPATTQFDSVAPPMTTLFASQPNFAPYTVVPNRIRIDELNGQQASLVRKPIQAAWARASTQMFKGHEHTPDSVDSSLLNRVIWYSVTGFKRPYPGDAGVLLPSQVHTRKAMPDRD
ncbi:MAG: alkaline phosphatase family protein [Acetobacteraceae bacterium]